MTKPAVIFVLLQTGAAANGGIESVSQVMLRLREHRPVVLSNIESPQVERLRREGVEVHVVPDGTEAGLRRRPLAYLASYWRYHRTLRRLLRQTGARVIHANDPVAFQLALIAAKTVPGVRIALNMRDTIDPGRPQPRGRYAAYFALADRLIFLSRDMAARFERMTGRAPRSVSVTYSIVDPEKFKPQPMPADAQAPVVLVSGVFSRKKGQLDFLRLVAPAVVSAGAEIWFAGDFDPAKDAYAAACADAAAPLGESVRFLGFRTDLPDLLGRARVLTIASRHEGLMRGMIEAMAVGRPVVSTDVCSASEMLEELSDGAGVVVPMGAHAAMAEAIVGFCRDRDAAERAGRKGAELAKRLFDPEEVVARYEAAYRAMVG